MEKILPFFIFMICVSTGMMTGGWKDEKNLNSSTIQEVAKNATVIVGNEMNSEYHLKLLEITKARKQVVSGINYKLVILIKPTECKKSINYSPEEIENCNVQKCDNPIRCNLTAWVQAWLEDGFKVTNYECDSSSCI